MTYGDTADEARYATTVESGIVGESLARLFIVETFLLEPDLFDTYIAFDPSLWWNGAHLVKRGAELIRAGKQTGQTIYMATSNEEALAGLAGDLVNILRAETPGAFEWHYFEMPDEAHATIYHPAALEAFRRLFKPEPNQASPGMEE